MKRISFYLTHVPSTALGFLSFAICPALISFNASGALLVIWPIDTSILSFLDFYDLEGKSCMGAAPDKSIPNKVDVIDLKGTLFYRVFDSNYVYITKPGCNRFVVDFRITKFTNLAGSKTFWAWGDAGLLDKYGNYGIAANLNDASDKDQCERMVVAVTTGWKKYGWSDFKMMESSVIPYKWTPSGGDPTKGTCDPGKDAIQQGFPKPDPGYGVQPTGVFAFDVYRVAISAGQTKVKSDFGNVNPNVGNADSTRISHWLYNGKPIPQMAFLRRF